jgi:prepilin signal peptidase PulO-like enzyme (type II secretory pathway)
VELATAVLFSIIYVLVTSNMFTKGDYLNNAIHILDFGATIPLLFYFIVSIPLVALFITDFKYGMLYDKILLPTIFIVLFYKISVIIYYIAAQYVKFNQSAFGKNLIDAGMITNQATYATTTFLQTIAGSIGIGLFFLLLIVATKGRGMGGGDLKLGFLIGLLTGWPNMLVAIFLGFLTGACASIILVLARKKGVRQTIPFGPFLIAACFVVMFFGNELFSWYTIGILGIN